MSRSLNRWLRSRTGLVTLVGLLVIALAAAYWFGFRTTPGALIGQYVCFPTCTTNDARMISLAGTGLETLAGDRVYLEFAAPQSAAAFEIGIFDGDTSGLWDVGTAPLEYTLYADPQANGTGTIQVGQWLGSSMTNNDWWTTVVNTSNDALSVNGYYFYSMVIRNTGATTTTWSNFKVRTDGYLILRPSVAAFAFTASFQPVPNTAGPVVYPGWPSIASTTYDGSWNFYMDVPEEATFLNTWDGDFDHGNYTCDVNDTDDGDTSNSLLPFWATGTQAVVEGVGLTTLTCRDAAGNPTTGLMTGNPPDNALNANLMRQPATVYSIITPDGVSYANANPSGNREWEQFRIESNRAIAADHYINEPLPAGIYHIALTGMDMNNLNAWRFDYDVLGICEDGTPCKPFPQPPNVGDYVWYDTDGDGVQDFDEAGIPNVKVNLLDMNGNVLDTHTTDANGFYTIFTVPPGTYQISINTATLPENLEPTYDYDEIGTPHIATVTLVGDETNLGLDFGYRPPRPQAICGCLTFTLTEVNENAQDSTVEMAIEVVQNCDDPVTYVAFGLPSDVVASVVGTPYLAPTTNNSYAVTSPANEPFHGVRFDSDGDGISGGEFDSFNFTIPLSSYDPTQPIAVEGRFGNLIERSFLVPQEGTAPPAGGTPPVPPSATSIGIANMQGTTQSLTSGRWKATVTVIVVDNLGDPVQNATVNGSWTGATGATSCVTDVSGQCSLISDNINRNKTNVVFTVSTLGHATYSYNSGLNVLDTITINRP